MKALFLNLLYINSYIFFVTFILVVDMLFFGVFGDIDYIFELALISGLTTLIFSPVYLVMFIRKETGKIIVNQYEAVSITLGVITIVLALLGIFAVTALGEAMSNIHY